MQYKFQSLKKKHLRKVFFGQEIFKIYTLAVTVSWTVTRDSKDLKYGGLAFLLEMSAT